MRLSTEEQFFKLEQSLSHVESEKYDEFDMRLSWEGEFLRFVFSLTSCLGLLKELQFFKLKISEPRDEFDVILSTE